MTYDEFLNFLDQFEEIKSFAGRIKYADQYLQRIGSGSGRIVYDIDGTKIFKIAKNAKGVAQNDAESDVGRYPDTHNIVTKIFEFDNDGNWLIAEKAKKVTEKRIKELTEIPSLNDLYYYVRNFDSSNKGKGNIFGQNEDMVEFFNENEFTQELCELISNYSQQPGDFGRPSTYGEVLRGGQPSIVLTDYGLNDEVYDTHYSPKRKERYRMYELFNLDGNDDYLSDIGDTSVVRHGMWGLIPYNVSDGEGVMNEDFISFVLNRDKYPTRPLPSMPYVVDRFHECVNNINKTLENVENKQQFYNNLLTLQEYLVSEYAYDRDLLDVEEHYVNEAEDVPNVEAMSAGDKEYGQFLANAFTKKLNLKAPQYLNSGSYGHAFRVGNDMVLKITTDISEVNSSFKTLRHGPPKHLAEIYKIYKIVDTQENKSFYVILQEYIPDRPKELFDKYNNVVDTIEPNGLDSFSIMKKMRKNADYNEILEDIKKILTDNPEANVTQSDREGAYKYMLGLLEIHQELVNFGIKSDDYTNTNNLGYKDGVLKYFDVGSIRMEAEPNMAQQDIVYLPEDGSSKFSTDNEMGQDGFPPYSQYDSTNSLENNLYANIGMFYEDLEYNHVLGDATKDKYELTERKKAWMPNAKAVNVKKKCRLGGLGNTSAACNQGDISNLEFSKLDESFSFNREFWGWVSPDDRLIQVPKLKHLGWIMTQYKDEPFGWDGERVFDKALEDGWVRVTYEYSPQQFRGDLNINGNTKERVVNVFKKFFFDMVKYGYYTIYLEWEKPTKEHLGFNTRDMEGKQRLINTINEDIDANEAYTNSDSIKTLINGRRDVAFIELDKSNAKIIQKHGLGVLPVRVTPANTLMCVIYRNADKGKKLYNFAKSRGGYLTDKTPEEAYEVGKLLGYRDESIKEYIHRKYGNKIPVLPEPSPDDYNDLDEQVSSGKYYRAVGEFLGEEFEFQPEGYYEAVDDDGNPIIRYDTHWKSDKPEIAASKSIGGAVMGLYSMFQHHGQKPTIFYLYEINEEPDVDISHWTSGDFSYLQEVRYRRPVDGKYIGKVRITDEIIKTLSAYYEIANLEPYDEPDEEAYEIFQNVDFDEFLANMRNKLQENLNYDELNRGVFKDEPIHVQNFPLKDLTVSKRGMFGAMQDIKQGRPSQTNEPVLVFYNISNKTFLVEDGYHRVAQAYLNKEKTIPVNIYSDMWSDYVANVSPENKFNLTEAELISLQQLPFKEEIQNLGGKIYSVGGAVRDEFLGKESKDLDVLISGIPMEELEQILSKYGRVDAVGKSFGILKFKPKGATEDIDIAIPRTEKPTGDAGHKAFDVTSDHELPIEKDLERRDFTINAIAKDIDGNIVDPYGGQEDLENKVIRIVNPEAFSDDPLRMLRAVQFASRFGFTIEPKTMKMIQDNAPRIKEIPAERILTEFDKIVKKGNKLTGAVLLDRTGLYKEIFGKSPYYDFENTKEPFNKVKSMGEFMFLLSKNVVQNPAEFYKNTLKGDIDTYKEIRALQMAFDSAEATNLIEARAIASNMYNLAPQSLQSEILPNVIKTAANELLGGKYPKNVGELAINGNDLMQLGLQGKEIGDTLKSSLLKVYSNNIRNNREELLNLVSQSKGINEYAWLVTPPPMWNINGEDVDINFFVEKYDEWNNQNGSPAYRDPSRESVLEFLQNNYEDLSNDETLKKELYWKLTDREIFNES